ncbi:hypothetical protein KKG19_02635, partial [Patescibacteria group bacterium]|nr:hypothetical protein [Patescibacteria group bacterium]
MRDVYLVEDADQVFHRDKVQVEVLTPSIKKVYISEALTNLPEDEMLSIKSFYEDLGRAVESIGLEYYLPHLHTDPVKHADIPAREVYEKDVKTLLDHDVLVAEVSYPSLGVG